MIETEKRGSLASKVWCKDCGLGKIIKEIETSGEPTNRAIETLQWTAVHHKRLHPSHEPEVIIYRATWLD